MCNYTVSECQSAFSVSAPVVTNTGNLFEFAKIKLFQLLSDIQ